MDQPESSLIEGLQKLEVLAAYDFQKMDDLVQDLTTALDDTSKTSTSCPQADKSTGSPANMVDCCTVRDRTSSRLFSSMRKKRLKKRKGNQPEVQNEEDNISEASESSLDEALKDYFDNISQQLSDSDHDVVFSTHRLDNLALPTQVLSFAESDSLAENISPMRPQRRRKRQLKKMMIDPQPVTDLLNAVLQPRESGSQSGEMETEMLARLADTCPGKRKRCMKERSSQNSFDLGNLEEENLTDDSKMMAENDDMSEVCSSSLSSSESDGLYTNDEGRDGDDEQSDFFFEGGPSCGIPGIVPWWEAESSSSSSPLLDGALQATHDPHFESILSGSFQHMSDSSKRSFKARLKMLGKSDREIRAGRRRLKHMLPGYTLSSFMNDRQKWCDSGSGNSRYPWTQQPNGNGRNSGGEHNKRRRKTPPNVPSEDGEFVGENADPIPENNIGSLLLQSMGWTPGTGLGVNGCGRKLPVMAYKRSGRKGLGASRPQASQSGLASKTKPEPSTSFGQSGRGGKS